MTLRSALALLDLAVAGGEQLVRAVQWIGGKIRQPGTEPGEPSGPLPRRNEDDIRDQIRRATTPPACQVSPLDGKQEVMQNDPRSDVWQVHGVSIPMGPAMTGNIRRHMQLGSYELAELRALWLTLRAGDRVLELGAGCGLLAAYAAKVVGSPNVLTVECDPLLEQTIRDVFAANDVRPELVIAAVGDGRARRVARAPDFWSTRTAKLEGTQSPGEPVVDGIDLPSLLARHAPTVLVIDIEGAELELCGVELRRPLRSVIVETHGADCERAVAAWLNEQGFRVCGDWQSTSPDVALWHRHVPQPRRDFG